MYTITMPVYTRYIYFLCLILYSVCIRSFTSYFMIYFLFFFLSFFCWTVSFVVLSSVGVISYLKHVKKNSVLYSLSVFMISISIFFDKFRRSKCDQSVWYHDWCVEITCHFDDLPWLYLISYFVFLSICGFLAKSLFPSMSVLIKGIN